MIAETLLAQHHSAPVKVWIGMGLSGILELAGNDCLFENTLHDTFQILLFGFLKKSQRDRSKEKKSGVQPVGFVETTQQGALEFSKQGTYGQIWHCHA